MASLRHVWVASSVLAMLVPCLLAAETSGRSGGGTGGQPSKPGTGTGTGTGPVPPGSGPEPNVTAFLNRINGGNALESQPTSVCITFFQQFYPQSELQTVPAVGPNMFGRIDAFEANVTRTADPNSTTIGAVNGALIYVSQNFPGYQNKWTLTFNNESGLPANSSLNFEGFEPEFTFLGETYNYSIVGGTGAFACANGYTFESEALRTPELLTVVDLACIVVGCAFNRTSAFYLFS